MRKMGKGRRRAFCAWLFFHTTGWRRAGINQPDCKKPSQHPNRVSAASLIFIRANAIHRFLIKSESVNLHSGFFARVITAVACVRQRTRFAIKRPGIIISVLHHIAHSVPGIKIWWCPIPFTLYTYKVRLQVYWSHDKKRKTPSAFIPDNALARAVTSQPKIFAQEPREDETSNVTRARPQIETSLHYL